MEKSYSEKLARVFEIVGYLLLIPIILKGILWIIPLFIYGGLLSFAALFSRQHFIYGAAFFAVVQKMLRSEITHAGQRDMVRAVGHEHDGVLRARLDEL